MKKLFLIVTFLMLTLGGICGCVYYKKTDAPKTVFDTTTLKESYNFVDIDAKVQEDFRRIAKECGVSDSLNFLQISDKTISHPYEKHCEGPFCVVSDSDVPETLILYDPSIFDHSLFAQSVRTFMIYHECKHLLDFRNHDLNSSTLEGEARADIFACKALIHKQALSMMVAWIMFCIFEAIQREVREEVHSKKASMKVDDTHPSYYERARIALNELQKAGISIINSFPVYQQIPSKQQALEDLDRCFKDLFNVYRSMMPEDSAFIQEIAKNLP